MNQAIAFAGIAEKNASLFRRIGVPFGDPAAWFQIGDRRIAMVRDIERERVKKSALADNVVTPPDFAPPEGLDADRETATAQSLAIAMKEHSVTSVRVDRSFPMIFVHHLLEAGIQVHYDAALGVLDRRTKSAQEIENLAKAQSVTESVMEQICGLIARSRPDSKGVLHDDGKPLSSNLVRSLLNECFLRQNFSMSHGAIVVTAPQAADCHHAGDSLLVTEQPIIIDLFPRDEATRYWGDCTRTVVHGHASDEVIAMHAAVCEAKKAATEKLVAGLMAASVHQAVINVLTSRGYPLSRGTTTDEASIQHGTGHGIGLEIHEPILLDDGGGELLCNEVFTIEPGVYGRRTGGVRVEDMLVVTPGPPRNLNRLHEGLDWRT